MKSEIITETLSNDKKLSTTISKQEISSNSFKAELRWMSITMITVVHMVAVYTLLTFPYFEKKRTFLFTYFMTQMVCFGVTAGAHRFWTHRSYKAKWPLRLILLYCFYTSGQNSVYNWVRDHRVHHKYSETNADPHNSDRGFFFSHVGWLMMQKHPEVIKRGNQIDMSDIYADPIVAFGEKYFYFFKGFLGFIIPIIIPIYFWNETLYYSITMSLLRYAYTLNCTWSVNSAAHMWGYKPYDKTIAPVENKIVAYLALGEGWHNYHHVFPYDYKCAELGKYSLNWTTFMIDMFAKIGWAYDLKQPSSEIINIMRTKRGELSPSFAVSKKLK
ncbi:acyl-CoA Delta-9 desaturase-like [Leptopilina boulardi]|uniref:acyl-CoA Delta-9 desaturase-like n=1 Tax=Leptopilina boulardi TaxID=63433 RepID=UPI0021F6113A|nr:acyl-CoA Delta-9 desaturase-like [Leptopilina boulardi]XP_051161067.1 acyl-CoA Delta-9 desaturase-like [Leptopilina boulardi]